MAGSSARHRSTQALPAFVPPHSVLRQTPVPYPGKAGCLMVMPTGFGFCQSPHSNPVSLSPGSQANESMVLHAPLRHLQGRVSNKSLWGSADIAESHVVATVQVYVYLHSGLGQPGIALMVWDERGFPNGEQDRLGC